MPITPVTFPNHYVLTVETANIANPAITWRNSIDIVDATGTFPGPMDPITTAFLTCLQGLLRDDAALVRATLRNWTRGVQPFANQAAIWEEVLDLPGNSCGSGGAFYPATNLYENPTIGEVCVRLAKSNFGGGGRPPSIFLRNCVRDVDVASVAGGRPTFVVPGTPVNKNAIDTFLATKLGSYLQANPLPRFCNVHYSIKHGGSPFDSEIAFIQTVGLTTHDLSHKSPK